MSKEGAPAFQFYAAEYLADENVQIMTVEDEGCYIRLMAYCWREGSIPSDPKMLAKLCKGIQPSDAVTGCFNHPSQNGDRLLHPRLELERQKQAIWKEKSALGGRRSAHKRKNKAVTGQQGGSTTVPRVVQPKGNTSSSSSSSNNNKTPRVLLRPSRRAPKDFEITAEMREWAKVEVPDADLDAETRAFMDHQFENPKTDWVATWRNWIRNSVRFRTISKPRQRDILDIQIEKAEEEERAKRSGTKVSQAVDRGV